MTEARTDFHRLESISQQRLAEWDLTKRERLLAGWIVRLSFGRGRHSCLVPTLGHFCTLTGLNVADVSRGLRSLQAAGVLQISGPSRGFKVYTFLPNALLVEPDRVVDREESARCLAELEEINALGPGFEPGGQKRLPIETVEERLDRDQAEASRDLAQEAAEEAPEWSPAWVAKMTRLSLEGATAGSIGESPTGIGDLPTKRGREIGESPTVVGKTPIPLRPPLHASERARDVYVDDPTDHVYVGNVAGDGDVRFALDQLQAVIPSVEFQPWRRKWEARCQQAPDAVLAAIGDVKLYSQRNKVRSWGAAVFRRAQAIAQERGIQLT